MADENEIRQALGIDDEADPVAAIQGLQAKVEELETTLKADTPTADKAEFARLKKELGEAEKRYITQEREMTQRIIALEEENRHEKAERMVDAAVAEGRVQPSLKDMALKLALRDPKDFQEFVTKLPGIDLREHGVATDEDLLALEPTPEELKTAKQLGLSRIDIVRQKAADKGITLPPDKKDDKAA